MSQSLERQVLLRAREIIADPKRWTRGAIARDRRSTDCAMSDSNAVRFCAYGALERAAFELRSDTPWAIATASRIGSGIHKDLTDVNDGPGGRKAVLALFDQALQEV